MAYVRVSRISMEITRSGDTRYCIFDNCKLGQLSLQEDTNVKNVKNVVEKVATPFFIQKTIVAPFFIEEKNTFFLLFFVKECPCPIFSPAKKVLTLLVLKLGLGTPNNILVGP